MSQKSFTMKIVFLTSSGGIFVMMETENLAENCISDHVCSRAASLLLSCYENVRCDITTPKFC